MENQTSGKPGLESPSGGTGVYSGSQETTWSSQPLVPGAGG